MDNNRHHTYKKFSNPAQQSQYGFSLVEMVVFMVIVTTAIAGVIGALSFMGGHSADPLARKQAIAIAESLMQEIQQMPFTFCDPDDPNASTATSYADCVNPQDLVYGPMPSTESRYSATDPFDNVADYNWFEMPGSGGCPGTCQIGNATALPGLDAYYTVVVINKAGGTGAFAALPADDVLQIVITVYGPVNTTVELTGYRVRYAPRI